MKVSCECWGWETCKGFLASEEEESRCHWARKRIVELAGRLPFPVAMVVWDCENDNVKVAGLRAALKRAQETKKRNIKEFLNANGILET